MRKRLKNDNHKQESSESQMCTSPAVSCTAAECQHAVLSVLAVAQGVHINLSVSRMIRVWIACANDPDAVQDHCYLNGSMLQGAQQPVAHVSDMLRQDACRPFI
jgi:hypothetical protein